MKLKNEEDLYNHFDEKQVIYNEIIEKINRYLKIRIDTYIKYGTSYPFYSEIESINSIKIVDNFLEIEGTLINYSNGEKHYYKYFEFEIRFLFIHGKQLIKELRTIR